MDKATLFKLLWMVFLLGCTIGEDLTMDSAVNCGRTVDIFDREYTIKARADVTSTNPDYRCILVIRSGYTDSYYQIQITQAFVDINDCGVKLNIYEGTNPGGSTVKKIGCTTSSTGILYSKYGSVTFELITPKQLYEPRNDFSIRVKAFRDPNAPEYAEGGSRLPAGAIVGIILGIVILIAFMIILLWCYKTRRLPGMEQYRKTPANRPEINHHTSGYTNSDYNYSKEPSVVSDAPSKKFYLEDQGVFPSINSLANKSENSLNGSATGLAKRAPIANWNIQTGRNEDPNFNGGRNRYQSESDGRGRYRQASAGRYRTQSQGDSPSRRRKEEEFRSNNIPPAPVLPPAGPPSKSRAETQRSENNRNDDDGMSGVKRRRQRMNPNEQDTDIKRPNSGIFENPDNEGYMYDYDQVKKLSNTEQDNQENKMLHELKKELVRRQSMKENKGENDEKETNKNKSDDAPGAPVSKIENKPDNETKPNLPETAGKIDGKYKSIDQQSEIGDPDTISNPLIGSSNPAIKASVSDLRESPGTRKKKRRKSHKKYVKADPTRDPNKNVYESSTDKPTDMDESFDRDSIYNDSFRLPKTGPVKDTPLPPEALAPIFATDESVMQHYYPPNQYEMQNPVYPIVGYDAFGNPIYGNPVPSAVPYTQAGQPVYYVDQNGYPIDPNQQPLQYQPPVDFHPGMPGYTSTPSNLDQTPHRKQSPRHGRKDRTKSVPYYNAVVATPGAPSPIIPAGSILDNPRVPPPGTTLMNSGVDPNTGMKSNQIVWADANRDPTDPKGDNPQITRQTIVRVTTRDTEDGQLPQAPNAGLQQMTFNAAKQLKSSNTDPAFLSPSKGSYGGTAYKPQPVFASQTPERDNAAFYTRVAPPEQTPMSVPPKPIVHSSAARNYSVRDKITLEPEEHEF